MTGAAGMAASFVFQSTLLMRGATFIHIGHSNLCNNFNPRSSCEERLPQGRIPYDICHFNPRSSCEERRCYVVNILAPLDISIHAPHARSDRRIAQALEARHISIHAPHARSDKKSIVLQND